MFHRKRALMATALAGAVVLLLPAMAAAQSATANLNVTATVVRNCTITTTDVAFGNYDPVVTNFVNPLDGAGTVVIACTRGTSATIGLGSGLNFLVTRRMSDGAANYLAYELYQDAGRTTLWGNAAGSWYVPPVAPSRAARTYNVYGRVPGAQDALAGSYTDVVVATVNF